MAGPLTCDRRRATLVISALSLAIAGTAPPPASAADPDAPFTLPGPTGSAITVDVTGDDVRELVRVTSGTADFSMELEAWELTDGTWELLDTAPVPVPRQADHVANLMAWSDGSRERGLLLTGATLGEGGTCCLVTELVAMVGGRLTLEELEGADGPAETVMTLDVEADGTDELLVAEVADATGARFVRLLHWTGERFESDRVSLDEGFIGFPSAARELDGVPGEEVLLGPNENGSLVRLGGAPDGSLRQEMSAVAEERNQFRWLLGAADGVLVMQEPGGMRLMQWPRGGRLTNIRLAPTEAEFPLAYVFGSGPDAVIIDHSSLDFNGRGRPDSAIYNLDYEQIMTIAASDAAARLWELPSRDFPALQSLDFAPYPALGPIPGGIGDGTDAYFAAGNLITLAADGELEVQPASLMAGLSSVGVAGPGGGWLAVRRGQRFNTRDAATFFPFPYGADDELTLVPMSLILEPEVDDGRLAADLDGAVPVAGPDGGERLAVTEAGFTATVAGVPGSRVVAVVDERIVADEEIDVSGALTVEMEPRDREDRNRPFRAAILLVAPTGHAYVATWQGDVMLAAPKLAAEARSDAFDLTATVAGSVSAGSTVTINGQPVASDAEGAFEVEVDAPIWPQEVLVVARDPVGNETVERLEVVGFLDYRGLPWLAIVVALTLGLGVALFLRTPRRRLALAPPAYDDAVLEEIVLDEAEPSEVSGR
ncbi:MAG: hypothetical protein ACRDGD_11540 [Candidatus Limnocylindria bacterium]